MNTKFKNFSLFAVGVIAVLLLSACTVQLVQPAAQGDAAANNNGGLLDAPSAAEISAEMPYETQFVEVLGSQMAYVEAGEGDPILFLHGNPTSKYLWRNVMPWLEEQGRVIALDLIGMGESDKPDIDYTFAEHSEYMAGFIETLELQNVTLVIHDWDSGLGLDYAARRPENVKGIAMMEAVVAPAMPTTFAAMPPDMVEVFQAMRTEGVGEELILNQNMFVEQLLPSMVLRGLTDAEMEHYRAPYPDSASRTPTLVWPRQVPIDGEPADVVERVNAYNEWLVGSTLPKLHIYVSPGVINPPEVVDFLRQTLTNYETVYVGKGLHFIQEDHPEAIGRAVSDWVRRLPTMTMEQPAASVAEGLLPVPETAFGPAIDPEKGYLVEEISDGLYWITDGGYNMIFLTTGEGVIVVDAPPSIGENIFKAVAEVTDESITHLVYSHHHSDHIGAAALFADDVTVIAHEETLALLERETPCVQCLGPRPLPTVTFADSFTLEVGNQVLELEYRGMNHSPGNSFIYAPKQKVLMLVDIIFPGWVPFRSLALAEDVPGFIRSHEDALSYDFEIFVGGHLTRLGTRADVETAQEYVLDVQSNMLSALQTTDPGAIIGAVGTEIGFEHSWELFGAYQDELNRVCTEATLAEWGDRLGDAATFTSSHCEKLGDSLRID